MYDFFLGGKDNFEADRAAAAGVLAAFPSMRTAARENRAFLSRAVRYLAAEAGIRQFLDIGTGLPTGSNVHEVAQAVDPSSRVVYVDNDPLVLVHAKALLASRPEGRTAYIQADLREPRSILEDAVTRDVLDFTQPVALMIVAILHFIKDEEKPAELVAELIDALPSGSYVVASHGTAQDAPAQGADAMRTHRDSGVTFQLRDSEDFAQIAFAGLDLIPPGVVPVSEWRQDSTAPHPSRAEVGYYGAIARKR